MYKLWTEQEQEKGKKREFKSTTGMQLGGPFTLVDFNGRAVTRAEFAGKWSLLYFGFTNCPEVCPKQLQKMNDVVEEIDYEYGKGTLVPVFITIDPQRDSCADIKAFVQQYSPKIIGLCGTPEQTHAAAERWRVYYNVPDYSKKDDYLIDHSVVSYLMQPDGELAALYPQEFSEEDTLSGIRRRMAIWKSQRPIEVENPFELLEQARKSLQPIFSLVGIGKE
jgi:protein SCO1/2